MKLKIAWIGKTKDPSLQALTEEYLKRISRYAEVEGVALPDEAEDEICILVASALVFVVEARSVERFPLCRHDLFHAVFSLA